MSTPQKKVLGPGAAAVKYDVLTALGAAGLGAALGPPVIALRLMTLITARYNWQRDELSVGQREMARLWQVSERTAKRDMRHWVTLGVLVQRSQAARGRVARYRIDMARLWELTQPAWDRVGPDFTDRMEASRPAPAAAQVIRLADRAPVTGDSETGTGWTRVAERLAADDPARFASWVAPLDCVADTEERIELVAPSRFLATYVDTHLTQWIGTAVAEVAGCNCRVVLRGP
ncbi:DnaA N-terminal domain-containing protein [Pseudaestuariivita atlantica]|uniref:DnaA N-terminal domain-containing protein n=1 Tax=Pseudaestuariivita atlantica TaxID=1317121 RepID=A0A0L1JK84_9RHOB|nr:DnaA N-terminal domain-containing protein [Pseudaestuariivita atlantica]KNG92169.1 hypothetical protein ATO11_18805 [Pseudaestuariivita atlantica]